MVNLSFASSLLTTTPKAAPGGKPVLRATSECLVESVLPGLRVLQQAGTQLDVPFSFGLLEVFL